MTQININHMVTCDNAKSELSIDRAKLRPWLRDWKIGSLLNSPYAGNGLTCGDYGWTAESWRKAIVVIQVGRVHNLYRYMIGLAVRKRLRMRVCLQYCLGSIRSMVCAFGMCVHRWVMVAHDWLCPRSQLREGCSDASTADIDGSNTEPRDGS